MDMATVAIYFNILVLELLFDFEQINKSIFLILDKPCLSIKLGKSNIPSNNPIDLAQDP